MLQRSAAHGAALQLTQQQLSGLDLALAPFIVIYQANETDATLLLDLDPCARLRLVRARMQRARRQGLVQEDGIALYTILSMQLPRDFDRKGAVAEALRAARDNQNSFGVEIDRVPAQRWREWGEEQGIIDSRYRWQRRATNQHRISICWRSIWLSRCAAFFVGLLRAAANPEQRSRWTG